MSTDLFRQLLEAQRLFQEDLLRRRGVVGVAVGYKNFREESTDELAVAVLVEQKKPVAALTEEDLIPKDLQGARTDVIEVGRLEAQLTPRDRFRPTIPAGVSIGHYKITAGTLGAIVFDLTTGEPLILSNNHVLANSNDALIGDVILQPGPIDRGVNPDDSVAQLHRFKRIYYHGEVPQPDSIPDPTETPTPNPTQPPMTPDPLPTQPPTTPDPTQPPPTPTQPPTTTPTPTQPPVTEIPASNCDIIELVANFGNALAKMNGSEKRLTSVPVTQAASAQSAPATAVENVAAQTTYIHNNLLDAALARPNNPQMFEQAIMEIGQPSGTTRVSLGMNVRKHGRTTGYTEGTVTLVNATVNVTYNTAIGSQQARFSGQVMTTAMSQGGDSGSLILEVGGNRAVGLLFAGSTKATIFTPISVVLDTLNIQF